MAPQIRFVRDRGGHRIAYAVDGNGPALVMTAWWLSHVERNFADPPFQRFFTALAARFTVVRYDRHGTGLSDRDRTQFTLEDEVTALEAVVDALGARRVSLFGLSAGGPTAVAYAVRHPGRVERLVLFGTYARGTELARPDMRQALVALVRASWGVGAKTLTDMFTPDATAEEARRFAAEQVHAAPAEMAARLLDLTYDLDVQPLLREVVAPTLVLHRREDRVIAFECGRDLASRIPGAVFVPLDGHTHLPWQGDTARVVEAVVGHCGGGPPAPAADEGEAVFRRDGDVWILRFAGRTAHLKHGKGLADLAVLLSVPGQDVSATALSRGDASSAEPARAAAPVLDARALASYRARLRALEVELEGAERDADEGRWTSLRAEKEALLAELEHATALGGRARRLGDDTERARKAVSGRVRQALAAIRKVHPELAEHLGRSVVTGIRCSYEPDGEITWRT